MLATLLGAALLAAAPLDAPHAALLAVASRGEQGGVCAPGELRTAAANARILALGRLGSDDVILAAVDARCICGEHNCPIYAIRYGSGSPRGVLATFGYRSDTHPAKPLPQIVVLGHDSAMVSDEETFAYRDGAYVAVGQARVRSSDNARKPNNAPVRFAPGASSARLHGTASMGWYDEYAFGAKRGQKLTIDGVTSRARLVMLLYGQGYASVAELRPGVPYTLPESGTYRLHVELDSERDLPYALNLAIR
jgi:hypothetical protein